MEPANILKIDTLSPGWCDKDYVLLHACFQLLTRFYEEEFLPLEQFIDWDVDDQHKAAKKAIIQLYEWWQQRKKQFIADDSKEESNQYLKDNEMLKRLIDIRMFLWT